MLFRPCRLSVSDLKKTNQELGNVVKDLIKSLLND